MNLLEKKSQKKILDSTSALRKANLVLVTYNFFAAKIGHLNIFAI